MKYKWINLAMILAFSTNVVMAQDKTHKMSDTQKMQAAKADVYIINAQKKITGNLTTTQKNITIVDSKTRTITKENIKSSWKCRSF
jgi:hypothetical protein